MCSCAAAFNQRSIEPAGNAFAQWEAAGSVLRRQEEPSTPTRSATPPSAPSTPGASSKPSTPKASAPKTPSSTPKAVASSTGGSAKPSSSRVPLQGALPHTPLGEDGQYDYAKQNHYAVLNLEDLGPNATAGDIKKAHRKLLLKLHPDKRGMTADDAHKDPWFLSVQKAHEVLSDDELKRQYDSGFDFDEAIPEGDEDEDFFALYGPVFSANGRFSTTKPVPQLGHEDDEWEKVEAFYAFWFKFQSWRDPPLEDEMNLAEADSREEKRWMKRQNDRQREKLKKVEVKRIQTLVSRAYNRDPRVAAQKQREAEERDAAEAAKAAAAAAAEAAKAAEEEAAAQQAEKEAQKKAVQQTALKASRRFLKAAWKLYRGNTDIGKAAVACGPAPIAVPFSAIDTLFARGAAEKIIVTAEASAEAAGVGFDRTNDDSGGVAASEFDASQLAKAYCAIADACATSLQRAEAAAAQSAAAADAKAKAEEEAAAEAAAAGAVPWNAGELSALAKGIAKYPGGTRNRWQVIADYINSLGIGQKRSKSDCINKAARLGEDQRRSSNSGKLKTTAVPAATAAAAEATPSTPPPAAGAGEDVWTGEQQKRLEAALRKYPATMERKERWKSIASDVKGKTAKQCALRFKQLRDAVKKSK